MNEVNTHKNPDKLLRELECDDNGNYCSDLYWQKHIAEIWLRRTSEGTHARSNEILEEVFDYRGAGSSERERVRSKLIFHGFLKADQS